MKAKTKFMEMYNNLPERAKTELVYDFTNHPRTLRVISTEVMANTKMSKKILRKLGYEDGIQRI